MGSQLDSGNQYDYHFFVYPMITMVVVVVAGHVQRRDGIARCQKG